MAPAGSLQLAIEQVKFAREYTLDLIRDFGEDEWFRQPHEGVTHLAWQVGHLAMAEYGLTMIRLRGKQPEDEATISAAFFRRFQKGTQPAADPGGYPSPAEIRAVLDRVHRQALTELADYSPQELDVKLPEPHALFDTKLGSVFFCSAHELIHAGQIGLLRRLLGKAPLR
jgi:hypothetical protein